MSFSAGSHLRTRISEHRPSVDECSSLKSPSNGKGCGMHRCILEYFGEGMCKPFDAHPASSTHYDGSGAETSIVAERSSTSCFIVVVWWSMRQ